MITNKTIRQNLMVSYQKKLTKATARLQEIAEVQKKITLIIDSPEKFALLKRLALMRLRLQERSRNLQAILEALSPSPLVFAQSNAALDAVPESKTLNSLKEAVYQGIEVSLEDIWKNRNNPYLCSPKLQAEVVELVDTHV